jgi:hypothetical protein
MAHDVSQWLAEIRTLQRQLADTQKERDQAYASAANWRRLYETEARQRRSEAEMLRSQLAETPQPSAEAAAATSASAPLSERLAELLQLCQTLTQQLEAEKAAHDQTRQNLTTALGDTFDMLKPESPGVIVKSGSPEAS